MLHRVEEQLRERERALRGLADGDTGSADGATDLVDGLADLVARFDSAGPALRLHADAAVSAPDARTRRALLLIASEALVNAVRHAGAARIDVRLTHSRGAAALEVRDDGMGIQSGDGNGVGVGVGVRSMREWAASIAAELRVEGGPGRGTHVTVRFAPGAGLTPPEGGR